MNNFLEIEAILKDQPAYRLKQAKQAVFQDLVGGWSEVFTLPLDLRKRLQQECPLEIAAEVLVSDDDRTAKVLMTLADGLKIESVLMRHGDGRNTVCVSSQVGCPLGCTFCLTGQRGFARNLTASEIVAQVLFFARDLKSQGERVTNLVLMGMGEPFLNYDAVLGAIRILNDPEGFGLGARHISISTVGIVEGIRRLAEEGLQVNLAISLHAPNDRLRPQLMPINEKYPIGDVLAAVDDYLRKTRRRVMFEYVMIKDVNDSDDCARELAELVRGRLAFVNLIAYNPTGGFQPSPTVRIKRFKEILESQGVEVTERYRFGRGIQAACGQLAGG